MLIYIKGGRWRRVGADEIVELSPQPTVSENCVVVWEPDRQLLGVIGLEGDSRHAAVLIERRLRAEGTIDQEAKVLLHHVERVGKTYQALYSSVAMNDWQQLHRWSSVQSTHCAFVPLVSLAWSLVRLDRAVVVHTNDALHFFARSGARIIFCSVVLMDAAHESLMYNAASLSERAHDELLKDSGGAAHEPLRVTWLTSLIQLEDEEARQLHESFGANRAFAVDAEHDELSIAATPAGDEAFLKEGSSTLASGEQSHGSVASFELRFDDAEEPSTSTQSLPQRKMRTSLLTLAQAPSLKLLLNDPKEKLLLAVDRWFGALVLAAIVLAVGGLYLVVDALREASILKQQIQSVRADVSAAEADLSATVQSEPKNVQMELAFLDKLRKVRADFDVDEIMAALRDAAGSDLRILSVRSDDASSKEVGGQRAFVVDGLLSSTASVSDSFVFSEFVRTLARVGYTAQPIEARPTGATATDVSSRLFSYRVVRSESVSSKEPS